MLNGGFFTKGYDVIVLSTLIESTYQIYQKRGTNLRVVFGGRDLTDPANWEGYINKTFYAGGNSFTTEFLRVFSEKYECLGLTTPDMYISFLQKCLNWLPEKTSICLVLGATRLYDCADDVQQRHKKLNNAIKSFANIHPRIRFVEIDECINDSSDFEGDINHFSSRVYYEIAQHIIYIIQSITGQKIDSYSSKLIFVDKIILKTRGVLKRAFPQDSAAYNTLRRVYDMIYKHRK